MTHKKPLHHQIVTMFNIKLFASTPLIALLLLLSLSSMLPAQAFQLPSNLLVTTQQTTASTTTTAASSSFNGLAEPQCLLGNESYQLGERWNPNLPPFGVQVCVQCECIVRQRKSCYESKVTCRRITNECPIIDSCPDGKKPVTTPGQCCKSCQMTNANQGDPPPPMQDVKGYQASWPAANQQQQETQPTEHLASVALKLQASSSLYRNDRIKEYQSIIRNLQPCQKRDSTGGEKQSTTLPGKALKGTNKNDLNGIDSRLVFKSLDPQSTNLLGGLPPIKGGNAVDRSTATTLANDDSMRQDQQHPNDVQSNIAISQSGYDSTSSGRQQGLPKRPPAVAQPNACLLGGEVFQIGEIWNPVLPPFGVQVCVQCSCTIKQIGRSKACYEARVNCKRINKECPTFKDDLCPDGETRPVNVAGQCCKTCKNEQQISDQTSNSITTTLASTLPNDYQNREMMSEQALKEYRIIMRSIPSCMKLRDGNNANGTTVRR